MLIVMQLLILIKVNILYMKRIKTREKHNDKLRECVKEINNLKHELREIKTLIKEIVNK